MTVGNSFIHINCGCMILKYNNGYVIAQIVKFSSLSTSYFAVPITVRHCTLVWSFKCAAVVR
ncbi:hypothetical protein D917_04072 [Trichinella nativa]|uniref:Uncharacterized protein n=1 Tax=Trichinella nativa TaxID=6335 RepID=A0A1Y3E5R4_9BILA|nr:hypothetical protein D917_04072 [Trichinella nativa]